MFFGSIYHTVIELTHYEEMTEHVMLKRENRTSSFHNKTYEQECMVKKATFNELRRFLTA